MLSWLGSNMWVLWLVAGALFALADALVVDCAFLMVAIGCLTATLTALVDPSAIWLQVLVAAFVSVVMLGIVRPAMHRRRFKTVAPVALPIGVLAETVGEVTPQDGEIVVDGAIWSAHTEAGVISSGTLVHVLGSDGAAVLVEPEQHRLVA